MLDWDTKRAGEVGHDKMLDWDTKRAGEVGHESVVVSSYVSMAINVSV